MKSPSALSPEGKRVGSSASRPSAVRFGASQQSSLCGFDLLFEVRSVVGGVGTLYVK